MRNIIALDIGGTSIKYAIVQSNGIFLENSCKITEINSSLDKDYIINKFIFPINKSIEYLNKHKLNLDGIAISICGPFDYEKGISFIKDLDKYDTIYKVNLKKIIRQKLNLSDKIPLVFDQDALCFGRGEVNFNNYEMYKNIIVFTMGTGIGSCFIKNKKVVSRGKGIPWLGWISGQKYKDGILNDYTSSIFMKRKYYQITNENISVKKMAERARKNDKNAIAIFEEMGNTLGYYLKENFVDEFKANCIIFGGQISMASDLFIDKIQYHLQEFSYLQKITKAEDIQFAGLKGAALLLLEK